MNMYYLLLFASFLNLYIIGPEEVTIFNYIEWLIQLAGTTYREIAPIS